ncbi:MAG: bile acid:sodium symporter [Rhodospirillales bacterium]|nr:bile acid:sodium symporter [Rhodospirillales bacterium]MCW8861418.1 bile acid:sodium symporter [Rhodospirillales bacterium]MCW8971462.1 bile acid:sodium symporter [Rhodospirillales bacterium]MCW9002695.1 bile acid:sodium symporter [Rhodospirillales bacterium]
MQSLFLPIGLCVAIIGAWIAPDTGIALKDAGLIPWGVVIIFLVNGYQMELGETRLRGNLLRAVAVLLVIALLGGPALGILVARAFGLSEAFTLGLIVMSAMPPTLSSAIVMTQLARGNAAWALVLTITLNIAGVFLIPFLLPLFLQAGESVALSPWPLLHKLVLLVLLPFIAGQVIRRISIVRLSGPILRYIPSTSIIMTVWMSMSASNEALAAMDIFDLILVATAGLTVHLALFGGCLGAARAMKFDMGETWAFTLTGSQKTLPVAISVLATMGGAAGVALIACIVFHFLQLMVDSAIIARYMRTQARTG